MIFDIAVIALLVVGCIVGWHKGVRKLAFSWAEIIVFGLACALLLPGIISGNGMIWKIILLAVIVVGLIVFYFWSRRRIRINSVRSRSYRKLDKWLGCGFAFITFFLILGVVLGGIAMVPQGEVIAILPETNENTSRPIEFENDPLLEKLGIDIPMKTIVKIECIGDTLRTNIADSFITKIVYKCNWIGKLMAGEKFIPLENIAEAE